VRLPYPLLCSLLGVLLGWVPRLLHGPIPQKFDVLYIRGAIAVWGYYSARMLIGVMVGITAVPQRWYLRGPLCGFLTVFPLTLVSLAMPGCGWPCMLLNLTTATAIGFVIGGVAYLITSQHHL
jgi:hypothetical protein